MQACKFSSPFCMLNVKMPSVTKRNACVILFDVNTSPEFATVSKQCLYNIFASKWFLASKDWTKLILWNTKERDYSIHTTDVISYNPKLIQPLIENVETGEADWLTGLTVALKELQSNFSRVKGVITLQLLFISDFSMKTQANKDNKWQIEFLIKYLNNLNIFLYILGPKVKVPNTMSNYVEIREWSKNIEFISSENENLAIAKQIIQNTNNSIICDLELGQELFKCYTNKWELQPWKVPLTIGTSLILPSSTSRFLRPENVPKIKPQILNEYREPWKWLMGNDLLKEVAYEDVVGGIFKHNKFVPLPKDVEENFKYIGSRSFKVIGFCNKKNVPEYYMHGNGSCYVESEGCKDFKLLLKVLANRNKIVIARRVYVPNCRPKLVALLPEPVNQVFLMVELPYADNIRTKIVEQDVYEAPETDHRSDPASDVMYNYLTKLIISDPKNKDPNNNNVKVPLGPSLMDSWRHKLVARRCLQKYLRNEEVNSLENVNLPDIANVGDIKKYFPVCQLVTIIQDSNN